MLVLSRKLNQSIVIDGRITVKVVAIDGDVVRLGIAAPSEIPVHRQEVYDEIQRSNREALTTSGPGAAGLPRLAPATSASSPKPKTENT
jgi:carbon storage regulator